METPKDIYVWILIANMVITTAGFIMIKFNDFKHLTDKVNDMMKDISDKFQGVHRRLDKYQDEQKDQGENIARHSEAIENLKDNK